MHKIRIGPEPDRPIRGEGQTEGGVTLVGELLVKSEAGEN